MNIDRLQSSRDGSSRDVALHAAASALDECGDQLAGILETHRGVLAQADAAVSAVASRLELGDREWGDRGLVLAGAHLLAAARWQLEMLCNLAAAEFVMPLGSLPPSEGLPKIEQSDRRKFDVSAEAFLIRVVKMTASNQFSSRFGQ